MTKVNQLLEKAISTPSEEEAISCLRMARRQKGKEPITVGSAPDQEVYWRTQAQKYFRIANELSSKSAKLAKSAEHFANEWKRVILERNAALAEKSTLENHVLFWKLLSLGLCAVITALVILQ